MSVPVVVFSGLDDPEECGGSVWPEDHVFDDAGICQRCGSDKSICGETREEFVAGIRARAPSMSFPVVSFRALWQEDRDREEARIRDQQMRTDAIIIHGDGMTEVPPVRLGLPPGITVLYSGSVQRFGPTAEKGNN